ncbi:MAG: hypothetical protein WCI27_08355 [Candidatus Omnitrophota bacterium]
MNKQIYLTWQCKDHDTRYVVGELTQVKNESYMFRYVYGEDLEYAKKLGFSGYPSFPDLEKVYDQNVIESFAMRLPSRSREDFQKLLTYWDIQNSAISDFDLLSITGGKLKTDRFELIDPHEHLRPNHFLTELAGHVHHNAENILRGLSKGAVLNVERAFENKWDRFAVKVLFGNKQIGYIKKIHARSVANELEAGRPVRVDVKNFYINGVVNSILLRVSFDK